MGLLDGQIQGMVGDAASFLMLDATIHQTTETFDPATGDTSDTPVDTAVSKVGFPDVSEGKYRADSLLAADERMILLLQKPLVDAGLTVAKGDEITMRSVRSEILQVIEDPAQATLSLRVKP